MEYESHPIAAWHHIISSRDVRAIDGLLADNVIFFSPVVHAPQLGKALASRYLHAAFDVFLNDTFRYVRDIIGINDAVLEFIVEIDGITINGVDMFKWGDDGKITEFKVMLRPLKGVNLIHQKMGEMLENMARG
ncbi:MAG: nuclear transport factor 2 family protein [Acidobacteriota bacterium]